MRTSRSDLRRSHVLNTRITDHIGVLSGGFPGEDLIADKALAHVLTKHLEDLANLIRMRVHFTVSLFAILSHIVIALPQPPSRHLQQSRERREWNFRSSLS